MTDESADVKVIFDVDGERVDLARGARRGARAG
jgi:hypothetical protein